jgi:hypothetical protein
MNNIADDDLASLHPVWILFLFTRYPPLYEFDILFTNPHSIFVSVKNVMLYNLNATGDYDESRSPYLPDLPREQEQHVDYQLVVQDVHQGSQSTTDNGRPSAPAGQKNAWGQPPPVPGTYQGQSGHGQGQSGLVGGHHPPAAAQDADRREEKVGESGQGTAGNTLPYREKGEALALTHRCLLISFYNVSHWSGLLLGTSPPPLCQFSFPTCHLIHSTFYTHP